jgi:hypothetical protein
MVMRVTSKAKAGIDGSYSTRFLGRRSDAQIALWSYGNVVGVREGRAQETRHATRLLERSSKTTSDTTGQGQTKRQVDCGWTTHGMGRTGHDATGNSSRSIGVVDMLSIGWEAMLSRTGDWEP